MKASEQYSKCRFCGEGALGESVSPPPLYFCRLAARYAEDVVLFEEPCTTGDMGTCIKYKERAEEENIHLGK